MDTIYVSRLPLLSLVGVYSYEKENPQPLYLDLTINISLSFHNSFNFKNIVFFSKSLSLDFLLSSAFINLSIIYVL